MPSGLIPLALAWTLCLAPPMPALATAPEPQGADLRAGLEVDTSDLGTDETLAKAVTQDVGAALAQQGIAIGADEPLGVAIIIRRFAAESVADFLIDIRLVREGEVVTSLNTTSCAKCIDDFLVDHIVRRVPEIEQRLREAQPPTDKTASSATSAGVEDDSAATSATTPPPESDEQRQPSAKRTSVALLITGSSSAAIGLGALIAGAVVASEGSSLANPTTTPDRLGITDRKRLGYSLVGTGSALLAVGASLIAVGTVLRPRRKRSQARLSPTAGPQAWGLSLSGHF